MDYIEIPHSQSAPYSKEKNGLVERIIKDVCALLQAFALERRAVKERSFQYYFEYICWIANGNIQYLPGSLKRR